MQPDLIVVDGSNAYNAVAAHVLSACGKQGAFAKAYLQTWFDFDRLAYASLAMKGAPPRGLWVFHSNKPLGRREYRLEQAEVDAFWARQAMNPGCLTHTVDIPGNQQETFALECSACGASEEVVSSSEKGLDSSVICHLFETASTWNSACLIANDVDYAPVVRSLTRLGKTLVCLGRRSPSRATALERSSHFSVELGWDWLRQDMEAYALSMGDGVLDRICEALGSAEGCKRFGVCVDSPLREQTNAYVSLVIKHPPEHAQAIRGAASAALRAACPWWLSPLSWKSLNENLSAVGLIRSFECGTGVDRFVMSGIRAPAWRAMLRSVEEIAN